jgi:hypothetical protein
MSISTKIQPDRSGSDRDGFLTSKKDGAGASPASPSTPKRFGNPNLQDVPDVSSLIPEGIGAGLAKAVSGGATDDLIEIGITFVGPGNLPDRGLPDMFKVRRARVKKALEWLKDNNPLFENISISESRLAQIPEDDVPYELIATTKHSTDVNMLYAEQEGYVPLQEAAESNDEGTPLVPPFPK